MRQKRLIKAEEENKKLLFCYGGSRQRTPFYSRGGGETAIPKSHFIAIAVRLQCSSRLQSKSSALVGQQKTAFDRFGLAVLNKYGSGRLSLVELEAALSDAEEAYDVALLGRSVRGASVDKIAVAYPGA